MEVSIASATQRCHEPLALLDEAVEPGALVEITTIESPSMKLPRFSPRELFLLVVIAAMGCGWLVEHVRLSQEIESLNDDLEDRKAADRAPDRL
jgi:hypothetical protein